MKLLLSIALVAVLAGCRTCNPGLDTSILVQNATGSFVSKQFAERLALLMLEEKYPKDLFLVEGPAEVVDKGIFWSITYTNALYRPGNYIIPKKLTIQIRKTNGEIVAIS